MPRDSSLGDPEDQPQVTDGGSSASEQPDANAAGSSDAGTQDAKPAESSNADGKDAKSEPSILDVVKGALEEERSGDSSDSAKGQDGSASEDDDPESKAKTADDADEKSEDDEALPFHKHPRWMEVQKELKELRPLKEQIEAVRPKAEAFDQLYGFMDEAHLSSDEVNEGFGVMKLLKNDPGQAIPVLESYLEAAKKAVGLVLPPDLEERVNQGFLTKDDALAITQSQSREARASAAAAEAKQSADERMASERTTKIVSAIETWDARWKDSDPDHDLLVPLVKDKIAVLIQANPPKNAEEAIEIAEQARKEVSGNLKRFKPKSQAINPPVDGSAASTKPAPQTSLDVVKAAVGQ